MKTQIRLHLPSAYLLKDVLALALTHIPKLVT